MTITRLSPDHTDEAVRVLARDLSRIHFTWSCSDVMPSVRTKFVSELECPR
jgi:hypothetical protein